MATPTVLNNLSTTLGSAYTAASGSLALAAGYGATVVARLTLEGQSSVSSSHPLRVTVAASNTAYLVFEATALSGDTLTGSVVEGVDQNFPAGTTVEGRWTSGLARVWLAAAGTVTGAGTAGSLAKWSGTSALTSAVAGTDYLAPAGDGSQLTGITAGQVGGLGSAALANTSAFDAAGAAAAEASRATTAEALLAPKASPALTGTPTAPTAAPGTNTTQVATTAFVAAAVSGSGTVTSVNGSGGTTGLTVSGGPITGAGTLTLGGTLALASGGTGQTSAAAAFNALSPLTTLGDIIYADGANSNARLAGNITTTRKFLRQVGGGASSAAPAWDTLTANDVPATLNATTFATVTSGGQVLAAAGTKGAPGLSFSSIPSIGLYLRSSNLAFSSGTQDVMEVQPTQVAIGGVPLNFSSGQIDAVAPDAGFARYAAASMRVTNGSTGVGTLAAGAATLQQISSTSTLRDAGYLKATLPTTTDASYKGRVTLAAQDFNAVAGGREGVRVESDGTQALVGFYGATAVAKAASPGTATGTDAAVINAVITALRNLGLIT